MLFRGPPKAEVVLSLRPPLLLIRACRALVCERLSVLKHQSLLLTPRPLGRGDEILDRERARPAVTTSLSRTIGER